MAPVNLYVLDRGDEVFLQEKLVEGFAVSVEVRVVSDEMRVEVMRVRCRLVDGERGRVGTGIGAWGGVGAWGGGGKGGGVFVAGEGLVGVWGSVGIEVEEVGGGGEL